LRKVRVFIVSPPALRQLICYLFDNKPEFEICTFRDLASLAARVALDPPQIIVASVKPVGTGLCATALAIKESSPQSKLILICPVSDLTGNALKCGADSCLDQEDLVEQLLPTAATLSHSGAAPRRSIRKFPVRFNKFPVHFDAKKQHKKDYL
jgi:hypothetical protein